MLAAFPVRADDGAAMFQTEVGPGISTGLAEAFETRFLGALSGRSGRRVLSRRDLLALLGVGRLQQASGTSDTAVGTVQNATKARHLVALDLGKVGALLVASVRVLDVQTGSVAVRVQESAATDEELLAKAEALASRTAQGVAGTSADALAGTPLERAIAKAKRNFAEAADAEKAWKETLALEPTCAPAHLRLALEKRDYAIREAREHLAMARRQRDGLDAPDRALLEAAGPYLDEPMDLRAFVGAVEAVEVTHPSNEELPYFRGIGLEFLGDYEKALLAFRRSEELRPGYAPAIWLQAQVLRILGREDEAVAVGTRCLRVAPFASQCAYELVGLEADRGRWEASRAAALRLEALVPDDASVGFFLARAAAALGSPVEVLRTHAERRWPLVEEKRRPRVRAADLHRLAVFSGDFRTAIARGKEALAAALEDREVDSILRILGMVAETLEETADRKGAAALARELLPKLDTLTVNELRAPSDLPRLVLLWLARLGEPADARMREIQQRVIASEREQLARSEAPPTLRARSETAIWRGAVATFVTPAEAAAFAREHEQQLLCPPEEPPRNDYAAGRVLALAGRWELALPCLERERRLTSRWTSPIEAVRTRLLLGRTYEGLGRPDEARAEYEAVLAAWPKPSPRSITVDEAKKRLATLRGPRARPR